jgi:hypothetical protein
VAFGEIKSDIAKHIGADFLADTLLVTARNSIVTVICGCWVESMT